MKLAVSNLIVVLALLAAGCGTSSNTTTGPSLDRCSVGVTNSMSSVGAAGGNGRLSVTAGRECTWSVTSSVPWITPRPPAGAQGDGAVDFVVAPNPSADSRRGSVTVGNQTVELVQEGASCRFDLQPSRTDMEPDGGTGSFSVEGPAGCNWTPISSDGWITVADSANRSGSSPVNFTVAPNSGSARVGSIRVGSQAFTIAQSAPACRFVLSATNGSFGAGAGTGTVTVTGVRGCTWTASSSVPWISISAGASGNGSGTVSFTVQSNPGAARNGIVTIGGQRFTVTQLQAECSYSIAPGDQSFPVGGGQGTVAVSTGGPCTWTTTDVPPWITGIPATGSGAQTMSFVVEPNPGPARNVTLIIAGQGFVVSQAAGCAYSLTPTSDNIPGSGGATAFTVDTATGCTWASSGVPSWITGVPASGSGTQTINVTVAANTGATRTASIVINGQTFTVTQAAVAADCGYSLNPSAYSAATAGGSSSFQITTTAGCDWASSGVPSWITGIPATGTGTQTINFNVAANPDAASRTAIITVGGRTFTVTQAAAACTFSLNPTSYKTAAGGGSSSFVVTTTAGCDWTSTGVPSWITGVPASGTGTTTINFTVAANTGGARSASINIGGQTFAVAQAAACTYSLSPTSYASAAAGGSSSFTLTTTAACDWTSSGVPSWITGVPSSGTGTTTVNFAVAANTGPARSADISIGGQTFSVTQATLSCAYTVDPGNLTFERSGSPPRNIALTTSAGCTWTATADQPWITLVSGSSGTGSGTIRVSLLTNADGNTRQGNISVGGQTVTITQNP